MRKLVSTMINPLFALAFEPSADEEGGRAVESDCEKADEERDEASRVG